MSLLRVPDLGEVTNIYIGSPLGRLASLQHRQLARQVGDLVEDPMANSTAPIILQTNVIFSQGDTFVFGSWVCIANGAGSFLRYLTPTPEPKPAPTVLRQALIDDLAENFDEISLSDPIRELELESEYNSTSTHT